MKVEINNFFLFRPIPITRGKQNHNTQRFPYSYIFQPGFIYILLCEYIYSKRIFVQLLVSCRMKDPEFFSQKLSFLVFFEYMIFCTWEQITIVREYHLAMVIIEVVCYNAIVKFKHQLSTNMHTYDTCYSETMKNVFQQFLNLHNN